MKIIWATDIHLDHCRENVAEKFLNDIQSENADAFFLTGDFCQGNNFDKYTNLIARKVTCPTAIIEGNHDVYFSSIAIIRKKLKNLNKQFPHIIYPPSVGVYKLTEDTCLIGTSAWYDSRNGDGGGNFELSDFSVINDLKHLYYTRPLLKEKLESLGDEDAAYLLSVLPEAFANYKNIICLTHVPPFVEACMYQGKRSEDYALPYFSCKIVGDVLTSQMKNNPNHRLVVLSGHTHAPADVKILPNLRCVVGIAQYAKPRYEVWDLDKFFV